MQALNAFRLRMMPPGSLPERAWRIWRRRGFVALVRSAIGLIRNHLRSLVERTREFYLHRIMSVPRDGVLPFVTLTRDFIRQGVADHSGLYRSLPISTRRLQDKGTPSLKIAAILNQFLHSSPAPKPDVICFPIIDWSFRFQRPQQIMSQFAAQGHRVFYLSMLEFRVPDAEPNVAIRELGKNIYEISVMAEDKWKLYDDMVGGKNLDAILASLEELRAVCHISEAISYVMIASWGEVAFKARQLWNWLVVYDCMDEWENFPLIHQPILEMERCLVRECDLLVVTAQRLYEKWQGEGRPLVLARNGVDYSFYAKNCRRNEILTGVPHPVVGYFGAVAEWFDLDLFTYLVQQRPNYTFILLGDVIGVDISLLEQLPNVRILGRQPYSTMPKYLYHFDACIIPFKVNPITEATDPVKLYEYLSAGKPVVCVKLPEIEPYRDYVYLAEGREDFLIKLDQAVHEPGRKLSAKRKALARKNTWTERYWEIMRQFPNAGPRASIIIVTYNNLTLTQLCLDSILRNTGYPNYEVIIVDNNSSDGTPAYLHRMAKQNPRIKIILNRENNGFARANNQGIAQATGDNIVLLNNDTIVPPGWLDRLVRHLHDPSVGLVGPVTNFVGNEAKVVTTYRTWGEMESFANEYTWSHDGQIADIHVLAMFCVAMRRDVYNAVGPLDEQFGIGMFEDDDYALRMRAKGYRVVCALDVFVHHFGQAAFGKLIKTGDYNPIFEENRRRYEAKWNVKWIPHKHAQLKPTP